MTGHIIRVLGSILLGKTTHLHRMPAQFVRDYAAHRAVSQIAASRRVSSLDLNRTCGNIAIMIEKVILILDSNGKVYITYSNVLCL